MGTWGLAVDTQLPLGNPSKEDVSRQRRSHHGYGQQRSKAALNYRSSQQRLNGGCWDFHFSLGHDWLSPVHKMPLHHTKLKEKTALSKLAAGRGEAWLGVPLLCTAWLIMTPRLHQPLEKAGWWLGRGCSRLRRSGETQRSEKRSWLPPLRGAE